MQCQHCKVKSVFYKNYVQLSAVGIAARRVSARNVARSTRSNAIKTNRSSTSHHASVNKYVNRRTSLFKSNRPVKAPSSRATIRTHDSIWDSEGRLIQLGDIVSIVDDEDGLPYFAQIRGIITDTHGDQCVVLNWLIPTDTAFDAHQFDAQHFAHAISDDNLYPLEVCTFIQTAPDLLAYRREWTPRLCAEEQLRREMHDRLANLKSVACERLRFIDG
ncbi:unnamed protein product [Anisakis simplex]|uniref:BAH domain-containing protein n=1 Tax=Anisakis simplex TaxID=6269 RepID=A0A0M3K7B9_ANISI|nr:unnamed protein product [Anisakis simplex]